MWWLSDSMNTVMHISYCQSANWHTEQCHSTETAVTIVHNNIVRNIEQKDRVSMLVLLDLSAAFITVDHALLLEALEKPFGIHGAALTWYHSYLTERTETFLVGRKRSTTFVMMR